MKKLVPKLSMIVRFSFLLALLLTVSFSSCSNPDLADIVREHIAAVNNDDIEKNLTFFYRRQCFRTRHRHEAIRKNPSAEPDGVGCC